MRLFNALKSATTDRLYVDPSRQRFSVNVTDRKDFYHQSAVPARRAQKNILVPPLPVATMAGTQALMDFRAGAGICGSSGRTSEHTCLYLGFGAILQGDLGPRLFTF